MSKHKRNDPCYCGSGKKYKKCCGNNSNKVEKVAEKMPKVNLSQLHQKLVTAVSTKYYSGLEKQALHYAEKASLDNETVEIYKTGLFPWLISHSAYLPKHQTAIEHFIMEQDLSIVMKKHAHIWKNQVSSVYEVIKIDEPQKSFVSVKDILTDHSFIIPYRNPNDFLEGSLLIGTLIPFENYHNFLYTVIKLYNREKNDYIALLNEYSKKQGGMKVHFPEFFAKALTAGMEQFDFEHPTHQEVAQLFVDSMLDKNTTDEAISDGIVVWKHFCEKLNPTIKKPEIYAAALEYYVNKQMLDSNLTQSDLAKQFDVSASTISKTYIKILENR